MPDESDRGEAFDAVVAARRSVRAFQPRPLPENLLHNLFQVAQRAPSNCNVQPWIVHVASGEAARQLGAALRQAAASGRAPEPDIPIATSYPGQYRDRQIGAAKALFSAIGVARHDSIGREAALLRNFDVFGAPHVAFVMLPPWAELREAADCGIYAQTLMLGMAAHGVASCAQGALSHHADIVKRCLHISPDLRILFGIAFGYADARHPANATQTHRAAPSDVVTFHE